MGHLLHDYDNFGIEKVLRESASFSRIFRGFQRFWADTG